MQGYTFVKGEHYPVEHLVFETAPEHVEEFLEVDHEVWTWARRKAICSTIFLSCIRKSGSMKTSPARCISFSSGKAWKAGKRVDDKEVQAKLIARFESKFQHPYQLTRCIQNEENFGLHRYSRFERI